MKTIVALLGVILFFVGLPIAALGIILVVIGQMLLERDWH